MQVKEIWKDIPGYNGRYQASNLGKVRSTDRVVIKSNGSLQLYKGRILKTTESTGGYLYVAVSKEQNKFISRRLHRLIAKTFIPNPNNYPQINHINENKKDNRAENLEWCDNKYNVNYGHRAEKFIASMRNNKTLSKEVNQYDLKGNYLRSFPSTAEAARYLNRNTAPEVTSCRIGQCCRHLYKKGNAAYGYLWEFATNNNKGNSIPKLQIGTPIYQYTLDNCLVKKWENAAIAAKELGLSNANISRACKYQRTCGGFKWSKTIINN